MTSNSVRWALAAIVTVVLGGAIFGLGQGGNGSGGSATTAGGTTAVDGTGGTAGGSGSAADGGTTTGTGTNGQAETAEQRLAALGAVAGQGRKVFTETGGCGGCHKLADAGTNGRVGPDLDTALSRQSLALIRQGIVDPGAVIADGYPSSLMPNGFGDQLSKSDLDALVRYLFAATHNTG